MGLLARLGPVYSNLDLSAFEGYLVRDTGLGARVKVVLLCESPHCDEIGSDPRLPLVGQSGKSVAKVLAELVLDGVPVDGTPIGELVSERRVGYEWLGLMNACQLPLQRDAYVDFPQQECDVVVDDLETVRAKKSRRSLEQSALACAIRDDLAERWTSLTRLVGSDPLLVACGETARRFRDFAGLPGEDLPNAPHPSYGQWEQALGLLRALEQIKCRVEQETVVEVPRDADDAARRLRDLRAIAERCASKLAPGPPAVAHGDVLYDEQGLPR